MAKLRQDRAGRPGRPCPADRSRVFDTGRRWLPFVVLSAFLSLGIWGCAGAPETPAAEPSEKPPVAAEQSMAAPEMGIPIEEFKKFMTPERTKQAAIGAGVLLVTFMAGVGVGRSRKEPAAS